MDYADQMQTQEYLDGTLTLKVPVTFLMNFLTASCDVGDLSVWYEEDGDDDWRDYHGWAYLMQCKSQDSGFGYLVESMMERGFMPSGAIAVDKTGYIFEGHHRLVAAILLCLDYVYIRNGSTSHYNDKSLPELSAHWNDNSYPLYAEYV